MRHTNLFLTSKQRENVCKTLRWLRKERDNAMRQIEYTRETSSKFQTADADSLVHAHLSSRFQHIWWQAEIEGFRRCLNLLSLTEF